MMVLVELENFICFGKKKYGYLDQKRNVKNDGNLGNFMWECKNDGNLENFKWKCRE